MQQIIHHLDTVANRAATLLAWLAGIVLVAMMVLACSNMVFRTVATSLKGTVELVGFFGAVLTAFSLGYGQMLKGHIAVGILDKHLPKAVRTVLDAAQHLFSSLFFGWASFETVRFGRSLISTGELSETLRIIYHPFVFCAALGCAIIAFVLFVDMLKTLFPAPRQPQETCS